MRQRGAILLREAFLGPALNGAGDGGRTRDLLLGKQTHYHCATPALMRNSIFNTRVSHVALMPETIRRIVSVHSSVLPPLLLQSTYVAYCKRYSTHISVLPKSENENFEDWPRE